MKRISIVIAYLIHTDETNEEIVRQDLRMRFISNSESSETKEKKKAKIEQLIASAKNNQKDTFKLSRALANTGIRTDLSISDMLTYAIVADHTATVKGYLDAARQQDVDSIETASRSLASIGLHDAKSINRIMNDLRDTARKANCRRKDKHIYAAAPHRNPELDEDFDDEEMTPSTKNIPVNPSGANS